MLCRVMRKDLQALLRDAMRSSGIPSEEVCLSFLSALSFILGTASQAGCSRVSEHRYAIKISIPSLLPNDYSSGPP